jgi:hypothetical protein
MNLQENIKRILREERKLSARIRRRFTEDELEKEFIESIDFAYDLTKIRKVLRSHFLEELIQTTINVMIDGLHYGLLTTHPENERWYEDVKNELESYYRDRIIKMYNEREEF